MRSRSRSRRTDRLAGAGINDHWMIKLAYDAKQASGTPDPWPVYDRIPLGKLATVEEWGDRLS